MKLIILDPIYFHKEHINRLKKIGKVLMYKTAPKRKKEILRRIKNADVVVTASININGKIIMQCKSLKMICLACSGYNRIDIDACEDLGIAVTNVPSYATDPVAEHTFALLLSLMKKIREADCHVRKGRFNRRDFCLTQLKGKVFGIIGTGRIGSRVAKIANTFGCRVIANTLRPSIKRGKQMRVKYMRLTKLLIQSDIISLHVPLNESTIDLIHYKEFSNMRKRPILINTSRGKIINHSALVNALSKSLISGAGLDVLPYEPPKKDDPILQFNNVVFSPHNAFCTPEALEKCAETVVANIESFIKGKPKNMINQPKEFFLGSPNLT
jgi:lactate dehydrogenase-like 2-hydroxyacid dehydrogenase